MRQSVEQSVPRRGPAFASRDMPLAFPSRRLDERGDLTTYGNMPLRFPWVPQTPGKKNCRLGGDGSDGGYGQFERSGAELLAVVPRLLQATIAGADRLASGWSDYEMPLPFQERSDERTEVILAVQDRALRRVERAARPLRAPKLPPALPEKAKFSKGMLEDAAWGRR